MKFLLHLTKLMSPILILALIATENMFLISADVFLTVWYIRFIWNINNVVNPDGSLK